MKFLTTTSLASLALSLCLVGSTVPVHAEEVPGPAAVRTKAERDALTPDQVLEAFRSGNQRFVSGQMKNRDLLKEQRGTSTGQYPSAVVLSCIDSRAPAEFVFDKGIGEIYNGRVAGNAVNPDLAGSMEYACAVTGAKLVVVMGHTRCGAIGGAIDHVEMGNLTGLLERVYPAIEAVGDSIPGAQDSRNPDLVAAVTEKHVVLTVKQIRRISPILRDLEEKGQVKIVGALYDIATGQVRFLEVPSQP